tara:strand:+ start:1090 stop:2007 length:918 start_codon:yes stop_codon:yes gene_type:complete
MSEANRVRIGWRLTGSADPWNIINRTGDALNAGTETVRSDSIRSDRKRGGQKVVTLTVGGTIDFEVTGNDYDQFLAAAMCDAWTPDTPAVGTDQLAVGTADTTIDIIKSYLDEDRHVLMTECEVSQLQLTMEAGSKVTGQLTFMGVDADAEYDPSGDTFNEPGTGLFFDSSNNLSSIMIDGAPVAGMIITGMSLTINNNHQSGQGVGNLTQYHDKGSADITGSKTIRMSAAAFDLWKQTLTNTPISSSFTMGDADTSYTFKIGEEYLSGDLPSGALDSILSLELNTVVATDSTNEMLLIERTVTP